MGTSFARLSTRDRVHKGLTYASVLSPRLLVGQIEDLFASTTGAGCLDKSLSRRAEISFYVVRMFAEFYISVEQLIPDT